MGQFDSLRHNLSLSAPKPTLDKAKSIPIRLNKHTTNHVNAHCAVSWRLRKKIQIVTMQLRH